MSQHARRQKEFGTIMKLIVGASTFVILGLSFGYLTFSILSFSRTVEVPDLYGKGLVESNKMLTKLGLYLKIEGEAYDSSVPPGIIIQQDIPPGKKVQERSGIRVIISRGPEEKSIPSIVSEILQNAEAVLLEKGLKIGKILYVHSDTVEKDKIIAQNPEPFEQISDVITVLVSQGPYIQYYFCPDFRGMPFTQARDIIKQLQLTLAVEGAGGIIKEQKPRPGTKIKAGDLIFLKLY
jgi:serine/threonine-protein kinase